MRKTQGKLTYCNNSVIVQLEYSVMKTMFMSEFVHIWITIEPKLSYIHFYILPENQVEYHSEEKLLIIPAFKEGVIWDNIAECLSWDTVSAFEPALKINNGLIVKFKNKETFFLENFVKVLARFFEEKYPPMGVGY